MSDSERQTIKKILEGLDYAEILLVSKDLVEIMDKKAQKIEERKVFLDIVKDLKKQ